MTDHELIGLAAKAAGIEVHESDDGTIQRRPIWACTHYVMDQPYGEFAYNPLRESGQALDLAVKLRMIVLPDEDQKGPVRYTMVENTLHTEMARCIMFREDWGNDPFAATRRAIVRAAAQIGGAA